MCYTNSIRCLVSSQEVVFNRIAETEHFRCRTCSIGKRPFRHSPLHFSFCIFFFSEKVLTIGRKRCYTIIDRARLLGNAVIGIPSAQDLCRTSIDDSVNRLGQLESSGRTLRRCFFTLDNLTKTCYTVLGVILFNVLDVRLADFL